MADRADSICLADPCCPSLCIHSCHYTACSPADAIAHYKPHSVVSCGKFQFVRVVNSLGTNHRRLFGRKNAIDALSQPGDFLSTFTADNSHDVEQQVVVILV